MRLRAGESLASLTGGAAAAPDPGPTPQAAPPPEVSRQEIDVAQFLANTPLGQQARGGSFFNGTGPAAQGGDA